MLLIAAEEGIQKGHVTFLENLEAPVIPIFKCEIPKILDFLLLLVQIFSIPTTNESRAAYRIF